MHASDRTTAANRRQALFGAAASLLALATGHAFAAEATPGAAPSTPGAARPLHIVYLENELRAPGLTVSSERDETLVDYRYFELGRYLKERAPLVLAANGVAGDVTVVPASASGADAALQFHSGDPIVVLTATNFSKSKQLFKTWATVGFVLNVLSPAAEGVRTQRLYQKFSVVMGPDPVLGILNIRRLEPVFVDAMLAELLTDMAAKGEVTLANANSEAVRPTPAAG